MAKEYIEREMTCGDCIHADVCGEAETLPEFNRENVAYCGMFMKAADMVEVVRCKECEFAHNNSFSAYYDSIICAKHSGARAVFFPVDHFCSFGERRYNE